MEHLKKISIYYSKEAQGFTISIGEPITPKGIFMLPTLRVP